MPLELSFLSNVLNINTKSGRLAYFSGFFALAEAILDKVALFDTLSPVLASRLTFLFSISISLGILNHIMILKLKGGENNARKQSAL